MWKNVICCLWKVQKGTSSLHREMERPSKQVACGEAKFAITMMCSGIGGLRSPILDGKRIGQPTLFYNI